MPPLILASACTERERERRGRGSIRQDTEPIIIRLYGPQNQCKCGCKDAKLIVAVCIISIVASCKRLCYPSSFFVYMFHTFLYQFMTQREKVLLCDLCYSRFTHVTKMLEECHILKHNKHYTSIILNRKDTNKHKTELN